MSHISQEDQKFLSDPSDMLRVLIVEDHAMMREMLREFLERESDLAVDGAAATARGAIEQIERRLPDIVLVDLALPDMSGIELVRILSRRFPSLPMAILSGHREKSHVDGALEAGAMGYILKGNSDELAEAIRNIAQGKRHVSPTLAS